MVVVGHVIYSSQHSSHRRASYPLLYVRLWSQMLSSNKPLLGDLSRYFGCDVELDSVMTHTVQHHEPPGRLSAKRFDEDTIPPENRLPRLTSATWKYKGGAVGTLTHVIALHGEL